MSNKPFAYHDTFSNRLVWPDGIVTNSAGRMIPLYLRPAPDEKPVLFVKAQDLRNAKLMLAYKESGEDEDEIALYARPVLPPDDEPPAPPASRGTDDELVNAVMVAQAENARLDALATRYRHERNMLGLAIAAAAVKAGIIWENCEVDGPTLLMLCDDLATMARGRPEKMND